MAASYSQLLLQIICVMIVIADIIRAAPVSNNNNNNSYYVTQPIIIEQRGGEEDEQHDEGLVVNSSPQKTYKQVAAEQLDRAIRIIQLLKSNQHLREQTLDLLRDHNLDGSPLVVKNNKEDEGVIKDERDLYIALLVAALKGTEYEDSLSIFLTGGVHAQPTNSPPPTYASALKEGSSLPYFSGSYYDWHRLSDGDAITGGTNGAPPQAYYQAPAPPPHMLDFKPFRYGRRRR